MAWALCSLLAIAALAPAVAEAQTSYIPYFGKNQIRYDKFDWHTYQTEHFEIYYYPEIEPHLARIAGYAESAYQHVSSELKHDLSMKLPLILFSTASEFWQQNVIPGAAQEGVGAFAEPGRYRMVMPIDEPPDLLYRLIVHELTHQFQFDIIPTGLIRRNMPLWTMEGMADYMTGYWRPLDMMTVRDAAVSDIVPKMSEMQDYGGFSNPRLIYNLGHAAFEFIESKWGKEGVRAYVFALRRSVIGGSDDAYMEAFQIGPDEWDQQFDRYLKERFKPFRDKERPADYGRDLAPNPERTRFTQAFSIEPSPSGDLIAGITGNSRDREYDIVLISAKDGSVVRNLTSGFDQSMGFEYLATPGGRWNSVPWMSWSPTGDRIAYFVRTEKDRSLIVQNVVSRKIEVRIPLTTVDAPESPDFSPDGRLVAFSGMRESQAEIFTVDLETKEVVNLTKDSFSNYAPTWAPDGKSLVYLVRVSGNEKIFRMDADGGNPTQLTFGTHDESGAQFLDADTLVFSSTAVNPAEPIDPEVAKNGQIYNLWTLDLKTAELKQFTDALSGNLSPVVLRDGANTRLAFVTYFKGEYGLHTLDRRDELTKVASADFGSPGPIVDFQAPISHQIVADNIKKKGRFEKMFLEGRPPVALGVTSGGDVFGGTQVVFTDVLGDQQFNMFISSVSQYRTMQFSWINMERRLQWALQAYNSTEFFYGQLDGIFYDPAYNGLIDRDLATATRTMQGATAFGIYPFNRYRRVELFGGFTRYQERYEDPNVAFVADEYQQEQYGQSLFNNGNMVPIGAAFVQETTIFREFGPLSGSTMRVAYSVAPKIGNTLSRQTIDADLRKYFRIGSTGLLALRGRGFTSWGSNPDYTYFGGNAELRGYEYLQFVGQKAFFTNAELRFPLIDAMATPIGVLGGVRATLFAGLGGAHFGDTPFTIFTNDDSIERPILNYDL
ncbi:MAG: hypothetical protein Q8N52_01935, partial [Acidobacteriota bacterium]|nr:hypothetical protein [Acidobacteriota bacterium]